MVVRIYEIHVFDETVFLLATVSMITEKAAFSCFDRNNCLGNKFP